VLVEDCLVGPELSVMAFVDGERLALMPPARDYKRLGDGDQGPNTGGMGGQARPSYATDALLDEVRRTVLEPTLAGLAADGIVYRGVLYAGLMLTRDGPRVLEFNCRFGDPEGELVLPLLDGSLLDICQQVAEGALEPADVRWKPGRTYGVVVAALGYPQAPRLGAPIGGLDRLPPGVLAFHAGTAWRDGRLVTAGGRVLTLVGADRAAVYTAAARVQFEGKQYRADIGLEAPAELPVSMAAGSSA
jgi:phosphoribosylamine--glycine ligase